MDNSRSVPGDIGREYGRSLGGRGSRSWALSCGGGRCGQSPTLERSGAQCNAPSPLHITRDTGKRPPSSVVFLSLPILMSALPDRVTSPPATYYRNYLSLLHPETTGRSPGRRRLLPRDADYTDSHKVERDSAVVDTVGALRRAFGGCEKGAEQITWRWCTW